MLVIFRLILRCIDFTLIMQVQVIPLSSSGKEKLVYELLQGMQVNFFVSLSNFHSNFFQYLKLHVEN